MITKQRIVKIALNELLNKGTHWISIQNIAELIHINEGKLLDIFPIGDHELLMDAVEYAGKTWVQEIKKDIDRKDNVTEKLKILIKEYALGSKDYPKSLDIYIDLWKIIKDSKDEYIKGRLKELYIFYASEFTSILQTFGESHLLQGEVDAFSLIVTILSDVIHIQSITLENELDFDMISNVLEKIISALFLESNAKI